MASNLFLEQRKNPNIGQSLIEFALILPLLALLILGLFDLGMAVYTQNLIANASREGARTGILLAQDDNAIRTRVRTAAPGLNLPNSQIQISPAFPRTFNQPITVTVSYTYTTITPLIGQIVGNGGRLRLSSTSVMIVEGVQQY